MNRAWANRGRVRFGVTGKVMAKLDEAGIPWELYDQIKPNLTIKIVQDGTDALTHAIEGCTAKGAWEPFDTFHLKAIELISKNLRAAYAKAKSGEPGAGREGMALGWYVAGMGFFSVDLGIDHAQVVDLFCKVRRKVLRAPASAEVRAFGVRPRTGCFRPWAFAGQLALQGCPAGSRRNPRSLTGAGWSKPCRIRRTTPSSPPTGYM